MLVLHYYLIIMQFNDLSSVNFSQNISFNKSNCKTCIENLSLTLSWDLHPFQQLKSCQVLSDLHILSLVGFKPMTTEVRAR